MAGTIVELHAITRDNTQYVMYVENRPLIRGIATNLESDISITEDYYNITFARTYVNLDDKNYNYINGIFAILSQSLEYSIKTSNHTFY